LARHAKNLLQSVERALQLIEILTEREEAGVTELAARLGIGKSTAHRLLATLKEYGYVSQKGSTGRYHLGVKLFEIGSAIVNRMGIREQAMGIMEFLAGKYNETINLAILDGLEIVYIDKIESSEPLRMGLRVGTRVPAYCSALGKCILAFSGAEAQEEYLAKAWAEGYLVRYTANTIVDPEELRKAFADIQARGFSLDDQEYIQGIRCVASPILDHRGKAVAAISLAGPTVRLTLDRIEKEIAPDLIYAGRKISRALGHLASGSSRRDVAVDVGP